MGKVSLMLGITLAVALVARQAMGVLSTTSPGKASVFAKEDRTLDLLGNITNLTGTIAKGKKKRVLRVDVTLSVQGGPFVPVIYIQVDVNGLVFGTGESQCDTTSTRYCTMTGPFWIDLDAAEAANPGSLVNQPLVVTVRGGGGALAGQRAYDASFSAQLVKK